MLVGAVGYLGSLFLPWYREGSASDPTAIIGWIGPNAQASYVGVLVLVVLCAEVLRGRAARRAGRPRRERAEDLPRRGVVLLTAALVSVALVLFRLLAQPEGVYWGLFGGLLATGAVAYGAHLIEYAESREPSGSGT